MSWINRITNLLRGRALDRQLDEEIQFHCDARTEDNLAAGMTAADARQDASRRFGNRTLMKERTRDMNIILMLETIAQDLRYALRGLKRSPGFAITAILSLALGIGASTSIYTVADNLLVRPLPYPGASRLVLLWEQRPDLGFQRNVIWPANYLDWKAQNDVFESTAAFRDGRSVLTDGSHAEELGRLSVSAELLPMLGARPIRGRLFTTEEDRPGAAGAVIISYRIWQNWFGGDENVIGRTVQVNATPRTIVGVLPPEFYFLIRNTDVWEPIGLRPAEAYRKTVGRNLMSVALLKPGVSRERAQLEMTAIAKRLEVAHPEGDKNWTIFVEPIRDALVREVRTSLLVLLGAVGLLLSVACANVANLLLARYTSRRQEMAVRASLGAGRWRVVRQLLTESTLLGLAGGLLGMFFARGAVAGMLAVAPIELTRSISVSMDWRILLFVVGLSILTGIVFGLAPSLLISRVDTGANQGARLTASGGRLRGWLVGVEVALSVVLLAGAGLLFRSLIRLEAVDPGIHPPGVLTLRVSLPAARYAGLKSTQFFTQALDRIEQIPGVESASAVSFLHFNGMPAGTDLRIAGRPVPKPEDTPGASIRTVMPGYFRALGIPVLRGRDFDAGDNTPTSPHRFIVNEAFAQKYFRGEEALGKFISVRMADENPYGEIIGVTGDVKEGSLDKEPANTVYYVHAHLPYGAMTLVLRSQGDPRTVIEPVRRIIRELDPAQPIADIRTMDAILGQTFARQRFAVMLLAGFSLTALLLAAVGIYGVMAYSVSERTREVGVRVALGADPAQIMKLIFASGTRLIAAGLALGILGALALSQVLQSLLFSIGPRDPFTFIVVPMVLLSVALIAAWVPARRASKMDPMKALRTQ